MLNIDRVWGRASQRPEFRGRKLSEFGLQSVLLRYDGLTSLATVSNQKQNFPNGAIIVGWEGQAWVNGAAADAAGTTGLNLFGLSIEFQQQRQIVGPSRAGAASVFGTMNDQYPAIELYVPTNGFLIYGLENFTTSTINISITHHCLVPVNVG